jgi:protein TonB
MTTRSGAVSVAAIIGATVVGVVLLAGSPGFFLPLVEFDLPLGPNPDDAPGVRGVETRASAPPPAIAPPSPPLVSPGEPLLLARSGAMGMNDVVGYRFGERVPPPHWPPANVQSVPDAPPEPVTMRPTLMNGDDVARQLTKEYPAALRRAGIEGVAHLWIHIDAQGIVDATLVHETSGYEAIDQAAMNVARTMVFNPAMTREGAITAWLQIPIRFRVVD